MGWWITLGILMLLTILPLGVSLRYAGEKLELRIKAAFLLIPLNLNKPKKEKPEKPKKEAVPPEEKPVNPNALKPKKPKKDLKAFLPWIRLGIDFLGDLRRKLVIDRLDLHLILAGGDPCNLAVSYGSTWAAVGNILSAMDRLLVLKKQDVDVSCDFTAEKTLVSARVDLHLTLGRAVVLIVGYGFRALREFLTMKKRKGGASL